jgi:hypothetical protein
MANNTRDSPYYVFVALCIVVIVVSLIFKMAYFLSWPVQELLKKARVRCAIANSKIFAKTFNIFIRGRYLYQWYHYNHNAKRYQNVIRGIANCSVCQRPNTKYSCINSAVITTTALINAILLLCIHCQIQFKIHNCF